MDQSLKLLTNYLQDVLEGSQTPTLHPEDLSLDFRDLGKKVTLLALVRAGEVADEDFREV